MNETPQGQRPNLYPGKRLLFFVAGGKMTAWSADAVNPLVAVANALMNMKVVRSQGEPDTNGTVTPSADVAISDLNFVIHLKDA